MISLSDRLSAVAGFVTKGLVVADIGCDHAMLPIYLVERGITPKVIACDVNAGPVEIARNNILNAGYQDVIECRQGDGLAPITCGEVQSVVIAGMGGQLMIHILSLGKKVLSGVQEIILEPQSEVELLRHFLENEGYMISSETLVRDDNKFYPVMRIVKGHMEYDKEMYYRYGKELVLRKDAVLKEFLTREKHIYEAIIEKLSDNLEKEATYSRFNEIKKSLELCEEALGFVSE